MRSRANNVLTTGAVLWLLTAAGLSSGCGTAVGFAVGSGVDSRKDKLVKPVGGVQES